MRARLPTFMNAQVFFKMKQERLILYTFSHFYNRIEIFVDRQLCRKLPLLLSLLKLTRRKIKEYYYNHFQKKLFTIKN